MKRGRYFVSQPMRQLLAERAGKIKRMVDQYDAGWEWHLDQRRLNMPVFRMCAVSFNAALPGYRSMEERDQVRLVSHLMEKFLEGMPYSWSMYRGGQEYVFVDTEISTKETVSEIGMFLKERAGGLIEGFLAERGMKLRRPVLVADYVWFSIGRAHEDFGDVILIPFKCEGKGKLFFYLVENLPSTSSVISGALMARKGVELLRERRIRTSLRKGKMLPIILEADSKESEDARVNFADKGVAFAVSLARNSDFQLDRRKGPKQWKDLPAKYRLRFVDDSYFPLRMIESLARKQKQDVGAKKINVFLERVLLVSIDMTGYSSLVARIDSLYELARTLQARKSYVKYSALNTHTLIFGMQSLITKWMDHVVQELAAHCYYCGEFGGDGLKAVKLDISIEKLGEEIKFLAGLPGMFDRFLNDIRQEDVYSEAKVVAQLLGELFGKSASGPYLKVGVELGDMRYVLNYTKYDAYASYFVNEVEGGNAGELMYKVKQLVDAKKVDHRVVAISENIHELLEGQGKREKMKLISEPKYGHFVLMER